MVEVGRGEMGGQRAWDGKAQTLLWGAKPWVTALCLGCFLGDLQGRTKGQCIGRTLWPVEQGIVHIPYVPCSISGESWAPFPDLGPRGPGRERGQRSRLPRMPELCCHAKVLIFLVGSLCLLV